MTEFWSITFQLPNDIKLNLSNLTVSGTSSTYLLSHQLRLLLRLATALLKIHRVPKTMGAFQKVIRPATPSIFEKVIDRRSCLKLLRYSHLIHSGTSSKVFDIEVLEDDILKNQMGLVKRES